MSNHLMFRNPLIEVSAPDVAPPSSLDGRGREAFRSYLGSGPNKAFAAGNTRFGWVSGRRTADEATRAALKVCVSGTFVKCRIVNVNDKPVE